MRIKLKWILAAGVAMTTSQAAIAGPITDDPITTTITKGKFTLVIINRDPSFDTGTLRRMTETFFTVYPAEARRFNPHTLTRVTFIIDPGYPGVAETDSGRCRYSPRWLTDHPEDIDVVTHEVMHIVQDYHHDDDPGWLTEGIADYARYVYGVNNLKAKWSLPNYTPRQSYENAYRVTAKFLLWIQDNKAPKIVDQLDAAMRDGSYTPKLWVKLTGKTVDELWSEYGRASVVNLHDLQQQFVDLRFGMFIHFNIPTFMNQDWADPDASPSLFSPTRLDCSQWAQAAKSAHMSYGCLTTKHHSGFCIWNTKTTDYNVLNSPLKRDVVKEFADAFRAQGLKVCLYYSILDTHHKIRPGFITRQHVEMIKAQLTELLTHYGEITALIIDGWDAPWSRISYDDVPFEEIYSLVKSLQPNCLLMDLNSAKYPPEALMYTDIKSYEQGAGQHISTVSNQLPALSCLPLNSAWFWKTDFPSTAVKDPATLVNEDIIPYNKIYDNFILNVAPNRDGLIDENALSALAQIGRLWTNDGRVATLPPTDAPIISHNLARRMPAESSWSDDMNIMDFGNDDNFHTSWQSNPTVISPWYQVDLGGEKAFNAVVVTEDKANVSHYRLEYRSNGVWKILFEGNNPARVKIHRFERVWGDAVRISMDRFDTPPAIAEFGVYDERR
jgi:alpha-L-fucosidase